MTRRWRSVTSVTGPGITNKPQAEETEVRFTLFSCVRACSHGGGGPQVGEVPRLGGITNLSIQSLFFS